MTKYTTLILFATLLLSISCKKDNTPSYPAQELRDISYGESPFQKIDILFPEGYTAQTPVVFLIHGGGFIAGVKEDFEAQAQKFRQQNFIVVNLSHRLIDSTGLLRLPPEHKESEIKVRHEVADVDAAVQHYISHAASYHSGTDKMYMAGHSAGAMLAMLYVHGDLNKDGRVRASGNWAGMTEISVDQGIISLLDERWVELLFRTTGKMPVEANALHFMAISPFWVSYKNGGMPTISIFPENNVVLNVAGEKEYQYQNTKNYHQMLRDKGVAEKLSYYEGEDHGFGTKPGSWDRLIAETADFFRAH